MVPTLVVLIAQLSNIHNLGDGAVLHDSVHFQEVGQSSLVARVPDDFRGTISSFSVSTMSTMLRTLDSTLTERHPDGRSLACRLQNRLRTAA